MKKPIMYAIITAIIAAIAAMTIVGCNGDMGSGNEKMDDFLEKFRGEKDSTVRKYVVKYDGNNNTGGTAPKPDTVRAGNKITLPNKNTLSNDPYDFVGWNTEKNGKGEKYSVGSPYTPTSNVTLYADWQSTGVRYDVTVSSVGTGAYGGSSYEYRETVTIYAGTAPSGQQFKNWTAAPAVTFASANSPTTTFTMPANAVTVTANFEAIPADKYAVTVSSKGGGASGGGSYAAGQTVTINAGSDPFGHRFKDWTVTNGGVGLANANSKTTTFIMPGNAVTVTANFYEVPTYSVTIKSDGINASKDSSYREGDEVTINAGTALANQRFKGWTVTSGGVTLGNAESATTKFTMPANAVTVTANFGANTYTVTVSAGAGATGGGDYSPGETVTIKMGTAPTGFVFKGWATSSSNVFFTDANNTTTTFTMPSAAVTVTAIFGGTFTDSRNGQTYNTVAIGSKMWMSENLNYPTSSGSWCYSGSADNCAKYGRLYDWATAKTVCPSGWHLPDTAEWRRLVETAGGSSTAGKKLKSTSGWNNNGNGTDDFGFSALPGGRRNAGGSFNDAGYNGNWWAATEDGSGYAYYRYVYYYDDYVHEINNDKGNGYSVRCLQDD